ncbi:MAG: J domain-containing protein [Proteobacteria bacterium]|nr:J domain-containing protein [Pseudomonadota bacterium]
MLFFLIHNSKNADRIIDPFIIDNAQEVIDIFKANNTTLRITVVNTGDKSLADYEKKEANSIYYLMEDFESPVFFSLDNTTLPKFIKAMGLQTEPTPVEPVEIEETLQFFSQELKKENYNKYLDRAISWYNLYKYLPEFINIDSLLLIAREKTKGAQAILSSELVYTLSTIDILNIYISHCTNKKFVYFILANTNLLAKNALLPHILKTNPKLGDIVKSNEDLYKIYKAQKSASQGFFARPSKLSLLPNDVRKEAEYFETNDINPFEIFGVASDATIDAMKEAFKRVIREKHPDKATETTTAQFQLTMDARKLLLKDESRTYFAEKYKPQASSSHR